MKNISKATAICMLSALIIIIGAVAHTISNNYIRILVSILVIVLGGTVMYLGIEIRNDSKKH